MKLDWEGAHARLRAAQERLDAIDQAVGDFEDKLRARSEAIAAALAAPAAVGVSDLVAFQVGTARFAVEAVEVTEVVEVAQVTALPSVPRCYRGLITHRGVVYPLLDIRPFVGEGAGTDALPFPRALLCDADGRAIAIGATEVDGIVRVASGTVPEGSALLDVARLLADARLVVND